MAGLGAAPKFFNPAGGAKTFKPDVNFKTVRLPKLFVPSQASQRPKQAKQASGFKKTPNPKMTR